MADTNDLQSKDWTDFISEASYSTLARYKELAKKGNTASPEELAEKVKIEKLAKQALAIASERAVSIDNAVSLNDYLDIATNASPTPEEQEHYSKLKPEIDKALDEFDELNDIKRFEALSPEEMNVNESAWRGLAKHLYEDQINEDNEETFYLLSHLAAQKLKDKVPGENADKIINQELEDLQAQFAETVKIELINQGAFNRFKSETGMSDEEIAALKETGDKGLLESDEEQRKYDYFLKIREVYLEKLLNKDNDEIATIIATEELLSDDPEKAKKLTAINVKLKNNEPLTKDEEAFYKNEFSAKIEKKQAATIEAAKIAYAREIDALACRTARVTGAKDISDQTKGFLKDFAAKHPKLYAYSKVAAIAGSKSLLSMAIGQIAGVNGLAAYSAYNTYQTYKKAYKQFQEQTGEKGFKNFLTYLKKEENADTRINLMRSLASSGIAVTFAIVGNATGLAYVPGAKTAANTAVNLSANAAKFFHKLNVFKKENNQTNKKALVAAGVGLAVTAATATFFFLPDETKEKIGGWVKGLFGGNKDNGSQSVLPEGEPKPFNLKDGKDELSIAEAENTNASEVNVDNTNSSEVATDNAKTSETTKALGGKSLNQNHIKVESHSNETTTPPEQNSSGPGYKIGEPTSKSVPTQDNPAPQQTVQSIPADEVSYTFDQRKGVFLGDTKGVGIHHTDTMTNDGQTFEGGTAKLPQREAGETEASYNERVIASVNSNISRNADLDNNYHAKVTITKEDGSTIEVKQHVKVKEDNDEIITKLRRKIKTDDDSYSQKTSAYSDKETGTSYSATKYRSHQVDSNTVGESSGVKDDKLLRSATVGNKRYDIVRDGDTGKKFVVESQRNEHGVYEQISSQRTTAGDKKTLNELVEKELHKNNQTADVSAKSNDAASPQPSTPTPAVPKSTPKEMTIDQIVAAVAKSKQNN